MPRPLIVRRAVLAAIAFLAVQAPAFAAILPISDCNQLPLAGHFVLTRDIDCSGEVLFAIEILRGTIELNGHALTTGSNFGIYCDDNCKVIGPGTITGAGSGIGSSGSLRVKDVTITLSGGGLGVAAFTNLLLDGVTITGATDGAVGATVKLVDSTITASAFGVSSGTGDPEHGGPCKKGSLLLRRSSVTGTSPSPCAGANPPGNCADVVSCKAPRVFQSTCGTSCQGNGGVPCQPWGICSGD